MNRSCFVLLLIVLFAAVAIPARAGADATASPAPASGVNGVLTISPITGGPEQEGVPNSRGMPNTEFVVRQGTEAVTSFRTDENGRFRVALAPGHYRVELPAPRSKIGFYGPFEVDVAAGQWTTVEWRCDSGMR